MKAAVVLTIKNASEMPFENRKQIADWLREQVRFFIKHNDQLSPRFTARYFYK